MQTVKKVLLVALMAISVTGYAQNEPRPEKEQERGWHWYEVKPPEEPEHEPEPTPPPEKVWREENATEFRKTFQKAYEKALDKALMFPTAENFAEYKRLQDFIVNKSTRFAQSSREAYLRFPELDYNLQYSNANATAPIYYKEQRRKEQEAITELTRTNGLFFFYQGKNPIDVGMAYVVKAFAENYKLKVLMISVDGELPSDLPESLTDTGQAANMNVHHFPALFLVNPKEKSYRPVSYGFRAQDALAAQFRLIATDFEPDF